MLLKPRFRPNGFLKLVEPDTLLFFTAAGTVQYQGALYYRLGTLIDGNHTVNEIAALLKNEFKPMEILGGFNTLQKNGFLEESSNNPLYSSPTLPPEQINGWYGLNLDPAKLVPARIAIHGFGQGDVSGFETLLESMSFQIVPPDSPAATIDIVLVDDYLNPELAAFNKQAKRPWLLVGPYTTPLMVGPLFQPGKTACYICLQQRLQLQRQVDLLYASQSQVFPPYPASMLPASAQIAYGIAVMEIARWLDDPAKSPLLNTVNTIHPLTLEVTRHKLIKRPQCPFCGDPSRHEPKPIVLANSPKVIESVAGFRTASPAETIRRYEHHVSPITGIAPTLQLVPNKGLAYTYVTGAPSVGRLTNWNGVRQLRQSSASGKGITELQAKASGLCEAIERYSGVYEGNEPAINACYTDLASQAIHPSLLLHFSDRQYDERLQRNQTASNMKAFIPVRFDESRSIDWSPVWSLMANSWKYIPTAYAYYSYPLPQDHVFCFGDSNGNAAGSSLEDAILQGFLELVERDAVAIWWYNKLQRPAVDLDGIDSAYIAQLRDYYRSIKREFWALDLTVDLGIPVFCAISRRVEGPYEMPFCGFGAHLDPKIALTRAVSEMNQMLDPIRSSPTPEEGSAMIGQSTADMPYMLPGSTMPVRKIADYSYVPSRDLLDDLHYVLRILADRGLEMFVLDQTRPDMLLPVVKVIVPELRHFWQRFGEGRLYDVPVTLGWLNHGGGKKNLTPSFLLVEASGLMMSDANRELTLTLRPGVTLEFEPPDRATLSNLQRSLVYTELSPLVCRVLGVLAAGSSTRTMLRQLVAAGGKVPDVLWLEREINTMLSSGWLSETVVEDGNPIASRVRISPGFRPQTYDPALTYVPSRFACLRIADGKPIIESPLAHAYIIFHGWHGGALFSLLAQERLPELDGLRPTTVQALIRLLAETGLLTVLEASGRTAEDQDPSLRLWEFHDLMFHARSRSGRNIGSLGATYRLRGEIDHPPVTKPPMSDDIVALTTPNLDELEASDPSLLWTMEHRRSLRRQDGGSLSVEQLGEFFYRTARLKGEFDNGEYKASSRPYPGGGAIYELELYMAAERCDRLPDGLYHYCPRRHVLEKLPSLPEQWRLLIDHAALAMGMAGRPRALISIACRFQRLSWKYEGLAYALALKDVGVLLQTFYLVATAMKLNPCALGSGNPDLLCAATGLDYYLESSVGEFALC